MNQELELIAARILRLRRQAEGISNALNDLTANLVNLDRMTDFIMRQSLVGRTFEAEAIGVVSDFYCVDVPLLMSKCRKARITSARQVVCYLLREHAGLRFERIGLLLGRDHTTVIHSHNLIAARVKHEPAFRKTVERLLKTIKTRVKELPLNAVEAQENHVKSNHDGEGTHAVSTDIPVNHLQVTSQAATAGL